MIGCGRQDQETEPAPVPPQKPAPAVARPAAGPAKTGDKTAKAKGDPIERLLQELAYGREPGILFTLKALGTPERNPAWAKAHADADQRARISEAILKRMTALGSGHAQAAGVMHVWVIPAQVPTLIEFMERTGQHEQAVMRSLSEIKDPRSVAAIAKLFNKSGGHRTAASRAFQKLGPALCERAVLAYFHDAQTGEREEARRLIGYFRTKPDLIIDQTLLDLKAEPAKRRYWTCDWLLKFDPKQPRRAEIAKTLEKLVTDTEGQVNRRAVPALVRLAGPENVPCLAAYLLDPKNDWGRRDVVLYLGKTKDARAAAAVVRELDRRDNWASAEEAVKAMGSVAEAELIKLLADGEPPVRRRAVKLLELVGSTASVPALQAAAGDSDGGIRADAERALRTIAKKAK
jgi:HEAT repeat protein